jgi:hypothetical protein
MSNIELSRGMEAYFAFAEVPPTQEGRRFTITLTYLEGGRVDRLQWWWQVNAAEERAGEVVRAARRQEAIDRFHRHIEAWLANSRRRLTGGDPFPVLEPAAQPRAAAPGYPEAVPAYARMTAGR